MARLRKAELDAKDLIYYKDKFKINNNSFRLSKAYLGYDTG